MQQLSISLGQYHGVVLICDCYGLFQEISGLWDVKADLLRVLRYTDQRLSAFRRFQFWTLQSPGRQRWALTWSIRVLVAELALSAR